MPLAMMEQIKVRSEHTRPCLAKQGASLFASTNIKAKVITEQVGELKESDIRPREIPSLRDSVFLANMRSHKKVFHRLAEFGKML